MLFAAVAILSVPLLSGEHLQSGHDVQASDHEYRIGKPDPDLPHEAAGHCHVSLDCSVQDVFDVRRGAQIRAVGRWRSFQFANDTRQGPAVAFDPPPPRVPS